MVGDGTIPPGHAAEGGIGLHFVGTELAEVVSARPEATAYFVTPAGGTVHQEPLPSTPLV